MKKILIVISFLGLVMTIIPSFFVFAGELTLETTKNYMLVGSLIWLFTTPYWINKKKETN